MWRVVDYALSRRAARKLYYFLNYCWTNLHGSQNLQTKDFKFVSIGRHTYGIRQSTIIGTTATSPVTIGHFCSIAPGVTLLGEVGHRTDLPSSYPFRTLLFRRGQRAPEEHFNFDATSRGPITIGNDVWIGQNVTVLSGVTVGTGAVIGAGAVVSKDVPPYAVVAGNPAQVIRYRFDAAMIEQLLETAWWDLPDESLAGLDAHLYNPDIPAFIEAVKQERSRLMSQA